MFNGEFRSKPTVTHRGSSQIRYGKDVIADNKKRREDRASERNRTEAATKIQQHIRGYLTRSDVKRQRRALYDGAFTSTGNVSSLVSCLCAFYRPEKDHDRLLSFLRRSDLKVFLGVRNVYLTSTLLLMVIEDLAHQLNINGALDGILVNFLERVSRDTSFSNEHVLSSAEHRTKRAYRKLLNIIDLLCGREPIEIPTVLGLIFRILTEKYHALLFENLILLPGLKNADVLVVHLSDTYVYHTHAIISSIDDQKLNQLFTMETSKNFNLLVNFLSHLSPRYRPQALAVVFRALTSLPAPSSNKVQTDSDSESSSEEDEESSSRANLKIECLDGMFKGCETPDEKIQMSLVVYLLITKFKVSMIHNETLRKLCFDAGYLKWLWAYVTSVRSTGVFASEDSCMEKLAKQKSLSNLEYQQVIPMITVFSLLFQQFLLSSHDADFIDDFFIFSTDQLRGMCGMLRNIAVYLNNQDLVAIQPNFNTLNLKSAFTKTRYISVPGSCKEADSMTILTSQSWVDCYSALVKVLKELNNRDSRISIISDADFWLWDDPIRNINRQNIKVFIDPSGVPNITLNTVKELYLLQNMPYIVPFSSRVAIFHDILDEDRQPYDISWGQRSDNIVKATIRRDYIYEDAFTQLSEAVAPNLKKKLMIKLVNYTGLDEAGVDGGGLFREFLSSFLKEAFNPHRGLFIETDGLLHPNPASARLYPDYHNHYYFIGRLLAKALYEKLLVDIPLAPFFLHKLIGGQADINLLRSLDPNMYRNMLELRHYDEDTLSDLCLFFIVSDDVLGDSKTIELKPNGNSVAVTRGNLIEYIHVMADYRLNRQIRTQFGYFASGFYSILSPEWLHMFNYSELQCLLSGSLGNIDISDLKEYTVYQGAYSEDHPTILMFWEVVEEDMSPEEHQKLLAFVTSSGRMPLLGFRSLNPLFGIHSAGKGDRLPTSSTCMNLLKLPEFEDKDLLRKRLKYVIESGAGFELS